MVHKTHCENTPLCIQHIQKQQQNYIQSCILLLFPQTEAGEELLQSCIPHCVYHHTDRRSQKSKSSRAPFSFSPHNLFSPTNLHLKRRPPNVYPTGGSSDTTNTSRASYSSASVSRPKFSWGWGADGNILSRLPHLPSIRGRSERAGECTRGRCRG